MKTKTECLQYAAPCEQMAADADYEAGRVALLVTAAHWRSLANHAPDGKDRAARRRSQQTGRAHLQRVLSQERLAIARR